MYATVLLIHSWLRWAVIITGLIASGRSIAGRVGGRRWTRADDRALFWFARALDLQVLLGLLLYLLLSPLTRAAMRDFGAAMTDAALRFYAVEHAFGMIAAMVLVQIGRARIRKTTDERRRHTYAAIFVTIALVIILASIPWPNRPFGRPLFRW